MPGGGAIRGEVRFRVSLKSKGAYSERCFLLLLCCLVYLVLEIIVKGWYCGGSIWFICVFFISLYLRGELRGRIFLFSSIVSTLGCFILFVVYYFLPLYFLSFSSTYLYSYSCYHTSTTITTNALGVHPLFLLSFRSFFISSILSCFFILFLFYFGLAGRKIHIFFFCAPFLLFLFFLLWFLLVWWDWLDLRGWVYLCIYVAIS